MMPPWESISKAHRQLFINDLRLHQYVAPEQEKRAKLVYDNLRTRLAGYDPPSAWPKTKEQRDNG